MRLIDADALLEELDKTEWRHIKQSIINAPTVQRKWTNGCNSTVPEALRYLAENPRPASGNERFNSEHLYQLANEIELAYSTTVQREGWVLVPNKMTDEMENCWDGYYDGSYTAEECYDKMLSVIPTDTTNETNN